jgi:hypothetical protein
VKEIYHFINKAEQYEQQSSAIEKKETKLHETLKEKNVEKEMTIRQGNDLFRSNEREKERE